MGQRSQIYIRWNVEENEKNYHGFIARYFSWNYGERMVSRARSIMELLTEEFLKYKFLFDDPQGIKKLERLCDVNFDMRDITLSTDIIKEVAKEFDCDTSYIFNQGNNDGQLFIDVTNDGIKYCFMKYYNYGDPMDAEQYMKWECEYGNHPDWHIPCGYMDKETIEYTEENIKTISTTAKLMTVDEIKEFLEYDYNFLFTEPAK